VLLIGNNSETYIERADVPRNESWIDQWKVLLGAAYGAGDDFPHQIYNHPIIAGPGTACTETYLVIDRFKSKQEAERFASYLRTRLVRFLVSLRKYTQHLYNERFAFVPDLPMDREWTDAMLYKKYGITKAEAEFIDSMIRPMGEGDD
jgi:site-specific DNA-methyltransferase (adenine-specific)